MKPWDPDLSWNQESVASLTEPPVHPDEPFLKSNLHTQYGAGTHNLEIKSWMLYRLSHPGNPWWVIYPESIIREIFLNHCLIRIIDNIWMHPGLSQLSLPCLEESTINILKISHLNPGNGSVLELMLVHIFWIHSGGSAQSCLTQALVGLNQKEKGGVPGWLSW